MTDTAAIQKPDVAGAQQSGRVSEPKKFECWRWVALVG